MIDSATGSELQAVKAPPSGKSAVARNVTMLSVVHGWQPDAERWLLSVFTHTRADFEAVVVDNSGDPRIAGWLTNRVAERLRVVSLDPPLGFGAAVDAGIEAAAGEVVVLFDPKDPEQRAKAESLAERVSMRAISMGGTCTGEHGIGVHKLRALVVEHGEAVDLMRTIKRALDPHGILNPGKTVPN